MTTATADTLTQVPRDPEKDREAAVRPLSLKLIVRLMRFTRPYAAKRNWLLLCVVLRASQLPLMAAMIGWIIKQPIKERNMWGTPWSDQGIGIVWAAAGLLLLSLSTQFVFHFRQRLAMELGESVIHDLRNRMFAHLQRMPMTFFDHTKIGRIISRFSSDAENVRAGVQEVLFVTMVNAGQMVIGSLMMALIDLELFALVASTGLIVFFLNWKFRLKFARVHRAVQESMSRVTATLAESVSGIRVTQGFVRQDVNAEMFNELIDDHSNYNMDVQRTNGLFTPLLVLNNQLFQVALLLVGGYLVLVTTQKPAGHLIQFFFLASTFFGPLVTLGTQYASALSAMAGAERVFFLMDREPEWQDSPDAIDLPPITGRVAFEDLTFSYVPGRPVLHGINFAAQPGQVTALVGATGSGKSSIINLIAKFYLPDSGKLLIDHYEIRRIKSQSLHKQMGIVLQANFLFTGTVMDNIRVGKPEASDDEVIEAATNLDCLDLLETLPQGLYTQVGERGGALSLGQRQLVCFTRAMLADPRILLLDEATSSVDAMTELRIQNALGVLFKGRTTVVVAHRLSTIRHADNVLVLDQGRIVERGTHVELLATGGVYANLYRQFINASEA